MPDDGDDGDGDLTGLGAEASTFTWLHTQVLRFLATHAFFAPTEAALSGAIPAAKTPKKGGKAAAAGEAGLWAFEAQALDSNPFHGPHSWTVEL